MENQTIRKIVKVLNCPRLLILYFISKISWLIPDKTYLQLIFKLKLGYSFSIDNPKTFNEKLNWLKLHDRNPLYTRLADKYNVKEYVTQKIGEEFVVPCYGKWDCFEDIDIDSLPNQFVIKTNHDSSGAFICRDKTQLDRKKLKTFVNKSLHRNYYWHLREWPYKNIKPCVIAEKLLEDGTGEVIRDYKFWCFNGEPMYMYCTVKGVEIYENFYDMNFEPVDINHGFPRHKPEFEKPTNFELMKRIARELSEDIPFVRIDFFDIAGQVYFGEYTFYDWGGIRPFISIEQDIELGRLISLKS